jgi:hypothetical protein
MAVKMTQNSMYSTIKIKKALYKLFLTANQYTEIAKKTIPT